MGQQNLQIILDGQWVGGVDSLLYPTDIIQGTYAWGVNIINRGGVIQTRPSKRLIQSFCGRNLQGGHWCRTMDDRNFIFAAIDGKVYSAKFPDLGTWTQLANVNFDPIARWVWFCTGEQATYYDASNNLKALDQPKNIVLMQDGINPACYWDASDFSNGVVDVNYVTGTPRAPLPIGTAMAWQDNRLWVVVGNLVFASDLLYPQSFQENTYLAEQTGFRFPRPVVNLFPAPVQGLLVMTESSMHTLMSYIQDRTQWQTTQGFQSDVNLEVGLVSPWAFDYLHGMPWFMTHRGLISYDRALTQNLTTVLLTVDGEMQRSKNLMGPNIDRACIGSWENTLSVGFPASSPYNRHTWVMDAGVAEKLNNQQGMCWTGIWSGTYPVKFLRPLVKGIEHQFELSYSSGFLSLNEGDSPSPQPETSLAPQAYIHLWENMIPNRHWAGIEDEINCSLETKAFTLSTDDYYRFVFAEFMIVNLYGTVPFQVYVAGLAGNYQPLFSTTLRADVGIWGNPDPEVVLYYHSPIAPDTIFQTYRRQVRHLRTSEFVVHASPDGAACIEIGRQDGVDKGFQLLIQWQGQLGIRQIKFFYDRQLQSPQGVCPVDESQTPKIVLEATA